MINYKTLLLCALSLVTGNVLAQAVGDASGTAGETKAIAGFEENAGRHGNGAVTINGQKFNADDLVPAGKNDAYLKRLEQIDGHKNLDSMREAYDELKPQIDNDPSSWAQATRTATVTPQDYSRIEAETGGDVGFWDQQLQTLNGSQGIVGDILQECTTTTVVTPGSKEHTYTEEKFCDLVNIPTEHQVEEICQRQAEYTETPTSDRKEKVSKLLVTEEGNGTICKRETRAENYRDTYAGTITSTIDITQEQGGLSCRREIIPESSSQDVTGTKTATLPLDEQVAGKVCDRSLSQFSNTEARNGQMNVNLSLNNEVGGVICNRRVIASSGNGRVVKNTFDIGTIDTSSWLNTIPGSMFIFDVPRTATFEYIKYTRISGTCGAGSHTFYGSAGLSFWDDGAGGGMWNFLAYDAGFNMNNPACTKNGQNWNYQVEIAYTTPGQLVLSKQDDGNCNDNGTAQCPAQWSCNANAPTQISGINVSAADVAALGGLYPGGPSSCVYATKSRVCSGTASMSNEISIASRMPIGTTSLSVFEFKVTNPQSGVNVVLTQTPTLANGWVVKFRVDRTNFSTTHAAPSVTLFWVANVVVTSIGPIDNGNCATGGSPNCPTQWSCKVNAPATVNGIYFTPAMAQQGAPLFPGASNTCVSASLDKVCSGTASLSSVISIADKIPAGVTAIRDFKVTVNNPQSGVSVVLTQAPTFANGWNAHFRVDRTNFSTKNANPNVTMTWGATVTTITTKVVDTGNCKDPGSTACPTRWSCDKTAPVTVNGILVTPEMAIKHAALFPGAGNTCAAGNLSRVCDGSSALVSSIYIGHLLSKDSTAITDFAWKVNNPQSGITVELVDAPSLGNGWIARFKATRNYVIATNPVNPSLTLNWNYLSELKIRTSIVTTGDCDDLYGGISGGNDNLIRKMESIAAGGIARPEALINQVAANDDIGTFEQLAQAVVDGVMPSAQANPMVFAMAALAPSTCPIAWVCTKAAPGEVNGIWVTSHDLIQRGELYPGENFTCFNAERRRTCEGSGSNRTVVSIADQVPADAEKITNFGWHVIDPGKGVDIKLIQTPAKANGWKAIFETTRTDWNIKAAEPSVRLVWDQLGAPDWDVTTSDQGNCSINGDEFCKGEWFCLERYPDDPPVPQEQTSKQFVFKGSDDMGGKVNHNFKISSELAAGIDAIHDFKIGDLSGSADVTVTVAPSKANGWQGTVQLTTISYEYEYVAGKPLSRYAEARLSFQWKVGSRPAYIEPPYRSQSPGPLYPGDDGSCKRAEKRYTCDRIWEGEVCFTDDDGEEMCLEQPETDAPPNDCAVLEKDETCTEVREECSEGGMSSSGHCYVSTKVYECKVTVPGEDVIIKEETTCTGGANGGLPCVDGSCVKKEEASGSMSEVGAHMVTMQTMMTDHEPAPKTRTKVSMNFKQSKDDLRTQGMLAAAFEKIMDGIIPSAHAQDDPFGVPMPYPVPQEDPPGNPADALGPGVAEDMLSQMKFFSGERESCKKMLGGLLDCCTKDPPDQQKEWWSRYQNFSRENGMDGLAGIADEQNADGTGMWDNYDASSTSMTLNQTFTSIAENVNGGGNPSGGDSDATMADLTKQFQQHADANVKPNLGWYCKDHEKDLAIRKNLGQCTYVGSYCQNKGLLGECIVKMHVSCCFNSPVTKLIRDEFAKKGQFKLGTPKRPQCGGIPLTELMKMSMGDFETDEVEARMAAGGFTPDIAKYAGMEGEQFDVAMFGAGNSLEDPNRKGLTERTNDRLDGVEGNLTDGFDAISKSVGIRSDTSNTDLVDPDSPGAITFNPGLYFVENGRPVSVSVNRNGGKGAVNVTLRSVGGTAISGTDYTPVNVVLSWKAGEVGDKTTIIQVSSRNRTSMQTIGLQISNPTGGAIINPLTDATVEIQPTKAGE